MKCRWLEQLSGDFGDQDGTVLDIQVWEGSALQFSLALLFTSTAKASFGVLVQPWVFSFWILLLPENSPEKSLATIYLRK